MADSLSLGASQRTDVSIRMFAVATQQQSTLSSVVWSWDGNTQLSAYDWATSLAYTESEPITGVGTSTLIFVTYDDTQTYNIEVSAENGLTDSYIFYPRRFFISPMETTTSTATLSAILSGADGTTTGIPPVSYISWNSDITDTLVSYYIKGVVADTEYTLGSSVIAASGDYMLFDSTVLSTTETYVISAVNGDANRTVGEYSFTVDTTNEGNTLNISTISSTDGGILLSGIFTQGGYTYTNINPLSSIFWYITPSATVNILSAGGGVYTQGVSGVAGDIDRLDVTYSNYFTTYLISLCSKEYPAYSTSITYVPQLEPLNMLVSAASFDNLPVYRTLSAVAVGYRDTIGYHNIGSTYTLAWDATAPASDSIWARDMEGNPYTFGTRKPAGVIGTIVFTMTANEFSDTPQISSMLVSSAYISASPNSSDTIFHTSSTYRFDIDEFPAESLFDINFKVNNEDTYYTNGVWRVSGEYATVAATAVDTSIIPNKDTTQGSYVWLSGSEILETTSSIELLFIPSAFNTTLILSGIAMSAANWLSAHSSFDYMDINFIGRFLSADFVAAPTYTWTTSAAYIHTGSSTTLTESSGVCAYGEGHTETFVLSSNIVGTSYTWEISGKVYGTTKVLHPNISSVADTTFNNSGSAILFGVFNSELPTTMTRQHTADSGSVEYYSNFKTTSSTDNTSPLFQNIRIVSYEDPTATITPTNSATFVVIGTQTLESTKTITYPLYSPVSEVSGVYAWTLSAAEWDASIYQSGTTFSTVLSSGDGIVNGTINPSISTHLSLDLTGVVTQNIDNWPNDWDNVDRDVTASTQYFTVYAAPQLGIYVDSNVITVNASAEILNITPQTLSSIISGFIWEDTYGNTQTVQNFSSFTVTYPSAGNYSIMLSAVLHTEDVITKLFTNFITVITGYTEFDTDVERFYGDTTLTLPNTLESVYIPPNEFTDRNNINRAFTRLDDNYTYLKNACKFYSPSPISYTGWLGSINGTLTEWNTESSPSSAHYMSVAGVSSDILSDVNDVVSRHGYLYVADDTTVKILSTDNTATVIAERSFNGIDDDFLSINAIGVDSNENIFVLDTLSHKVIVLNYNHTRANWELLYNWGGLGGPMSKTKLNSPNDLYIDTYDNIWIADTGNKVVKEYSETGAWLKTVLPTDITGDSTENGGIIGITLDLTNNLYILTKNIVYKYTNTGTFIASFILTETEKTPVKIISGKDGGFLYILYTGFVHKYTLGGVFGGQFANNLTGTLDYRSIYHDDSRDLYVANVNNIIKYHDRNVITDVVLAAGIENEWDIDSDLIDKEEYIQDWVYNIVFSHLYGNLALLRRSIIGKIVFTETDIGGSFEIVNFTIEEYQDSAFAYDREDISIGINEKVSSNVVNRCLKQLYSCQTQLLDLIT